MAASFGWLNTLILSVYMVAMVCVGIFFSRRQTSTEEYFLAGRRMPWLPVAMSMFASLTSAITYMGLPATAFSENISLVVVCLVSPILAPFLVLAVYPVYRRLRVTTSYEYIGIRFGPSARLAVSALFVLARLGWMGTVVYAPALALSVATGIPLGTSIILMGILATVYTALGGLSAVLWTDVVQFVILVGGAFWIATDLVCSVPDGLAGILRTAKMAGHLEVVNWRLTLFEMSGFAVAVSFFLQMMQDYGTDQVTVQRMLAVRDTRGVVKATLFNAGTDAVMIALLLFLGIGMFAYFNAFPNLATDGPADSVLPYYVMTNLPNGISGLIISAIFAAAMSSMDSGINSLATVIEHDFFRNLRRRQRTEAADVRLARLLTLILGILATLLAFCAAAIGPIIKSFATFMSLFNAPVLALFVLGFLSRHVRFAHWLVGALTAIPATLWLQRVVAAHWVYYFPFSFSVAFTVAWFAALATHKRG